MERWVEQEEEVGVQEVAKHDTFKAAPRKKVEIRTPGPASRSICKIHLCTGETFNHLPNKNAENKIDNYCGLKARATAHQSLKGWERKHRIENKWNKP